MGLGSFRVFVRVLDRVCVSFWIREQICAWLKVWVVLPGILPKIPAPPVLSTTI